MVEMLKQEKTTDCQRSAGRGNRDLVFNGVSGVVPPQAGIAFRQAKARTTSHRRLMVRPRVTAKDEVVSQP